MDPDLELRGGPSLDLLALLAFSLLSFLLFLPKINGGGPPGPLLRHWCCVFEPSHILAATVAVAETGPAVSLCESDQLLFEYRKCCKLLEGEVEMSSPVSNSL